MGPQKNEKCEKMYPLLGAVMEKEKEEKRKGKKKKASPKKKKTPDDAPSQPCFFAQPPNVDFPKLVPRARGNGVCKNMHWYHQNANRGQCHADITTTRYSSSTAQCTLTQPTPPPMTCISAIISTHQTILLLLRRRLF